MATIADQDFPPLPLNEAYQSTGNTASIKENYSNSRLYSAVIPAGNLNPFAEDETSGNGDKGIIMMEEEEISKRPIIQSSLKMLDNNTIIEQTHQSESSLFQFPLVVQPLIAKQTTSEVDNTDDDGDDEVVIFRPAFSRYI